MWFWYGILTAVFSAISVILNKKVLYKVSAALVSWTLFVLPLPILLILVLREGVPKLNMMFFMGAIGSSIIFAFTKTITLNSIKNSFMSKIFPLTVFGTLFSYIFALLFLSEKISILALFGIFMILIGAYILNVDRIGENILAPFKILVTHKESFIFIVAMIFTSLTGIFDKFGLMNTFPKSPLFVLFFEDLIMSILLSIYLFKKEPKWFIDLKQNFGILIVGSIIYTLLSLYFLLAITTGAVALVSAVKKLEILFVLISSYFIFNDKPTKHVWLGSVIMLVGVFFIKIG